MIAISEAFQETAPMLARTAFAFATLRRVVRTLQSSFKS
jgi:hypothetical protein